jgi:hypothetical protein
VPRGQWQIETSVLFELPLVPGLFKTVKNRHRHMAEAVGAELAIEYRAYAIGPDDRIMLRIDLMCDDDDAAKERAHQLSYSYAVELWRDQKLLARFDRLQ